VMLVGPGIACERPQPELPFYDHTTKGFKKGWNIFPDIKPEVTAEGMKLKDFHNLYKSGATNCFGCYPNCYQELDGQVVIMLARLRTNVAKIYRMRIEECANGSWSHTDSDFHSGNGQWETLKVTRKLAE